MTFLMLVRRRGIHSLRRKAQTQFSPAEFRRVQFEMCFDLHYRPLRSNPRYGTEDGVEVDADGGYVAVLVHPSESRWWDRNRELHIPSLVRDYLQQQCSVLQLAAFTMESSLIILQDLLDFIHDEAMLAVVLESDSVSSRTATPFSSPRLQPEYENQWSAFVSVAHNGAMWLHQ